MYKGCIRHGQSHSSSWLESLSLGQCSKPAHPVSGLQGEAKMGSSGERGLWGLEQTGFRAFWFSDWRKINVESPVESPVSFLNPLLRVWAHPDYCHLVGRPDSG